MEVERSEDGSEYMNIGFIPFTGSPTYKFVDENVESVKKYYYYRAKVRDSCGNIRSVSNVARSILLKVEPDKENIFLKHLSWSEYIGFNAGVKNYLIFRAVNDVGAFEQVGTTDSATTFFTDNIEEAAPLGARIEYVVKAEEGFGNIYDLADVSFSNYMPAYMDGRLFVPNAFAPEGKNKTWKPITHFIDRREFHVTVYNRWGQEVFDTGKNGEAWDGAGCPNDVYIYHITYKNSRAEYETVTGSVMLIR
jgi:gliding motility-associated-like protein